MADWLHRGLITLLPWTARLATVLHVRHHFPNGLATWLYRLSIVECAGVHAGIERLSKQLGPNYLYLCPEHQLANAESTSTRGSPQQLTVALKLRVQELTWTRLGTRSSQLGLVFYSDLLYCTIIPDEERKELVTK